MLESVQNMIHHHANEDELVKAKAMMTRLGITDFEQKTSELSGGQRKRLALVSVLITPCDILILDEPTNHLDSEMAEWLENQLRGFRGALVMVTHDRYFLDSVTNRIIELDKGKIYSYNEKYSGFLERKAEREASAKASERKRQSILRKEIEWMQRGARARSTKQKAHIQRYENLKNQKGIVQDEKIELSSIKSRMGKTTIELENISKAYDCKVLINDFSYNFLKGDRVGFVGKNGCGKTTLMKIILGLIKKDFGEIKVKGSIMHDLETPKKVGAVIEYPAFYEYLDAKRNLFIFSELYDVPKTRVSDVLKLVGLDVNDKKKVKNYSMGMKQRLSIARAFLNDPDIIILDEPTNGLDPAGVVEIENLILKLAKKENKTFIITSHILSQIEKMCNRVAIISNGKIVTEGNVKTLLSSDKEQYMLEFDEYIDVHRVSKILDDLAAIKSADNNKIVIEIQKSDIGNISSVFVENHMHIKDIQKITHDLEDFFMERIKYNEN